VNFITAIGQRWKRAVGASLTIALLAAVAVVGITLFSSEVLAAWKTPASGSAFEGVLNFEAPSATLVKYVSDSETVAKDMAQTGSDPLPVKNWKFTQNSLTDNIAKSFQLYIQSLQLVSLEQAWLNLLTTLAKINPSFAPIAQILESRVILIATVFANILAFQQAQINAQIPPPFRPPPVVPASPSL
jgi:hypothetical protein